MKVLFKITVFVSIIINFACEPIALDEGVPTCISIDENRNECTPLENPVELPLDTVPVDNYDENEKKSTVGEDSPVGQEDDEE